MKTLIQKRVGHNSLITLDYSPEGWGKVVGYVCSGTTDSSKVSATVQSFILFGFLLSFTTVHNGTLKV